MTCVGEVRQSFGQKSHIMFVIHVLVMRSRTQTHQLRVYNLDTHPIHPTFGDRLTIYLWTVEINPNACGKVLNEPQPEPSFNALYIRRSPHKFLVLLKVPSYYMGGSLFVCSFV